MLGQSGAIAKRPPHGASSGSPFAIIKTPITSVSTAATETLPAGIPFTGCWVTFTPSVDCYILFGRSDVAAASSTEGERWIANERYELWVNDTEETHFRVVRVTSDGTLERRRSNQ